MAEMEKFVYCDRVGGMALRSILFNDIMMQTTAMSSQIRATLTISPLQQSVYMPRRISRGFRETLFIVQNPRITVRHKVDIGGVHPDAVQIMNPRCS